MGMETCTRHEVRVIYDCALPKAARSTELCFLYNDFRKVEELIRGDVFV